MARRFPPPSPFVNFGLPRYRPHNINIHPLITDSGGNTIEITDYCPRFLRFGRMFRPPVIMRRIRPVSGRRVRPRVCSVRCAEREVP